MDLRGEIHRRYLKKIRSSRFRDIEESASSPNFE